jgi:transcriptional regulator with XRE-family HTH domain
VDRGREPELHAGLAGGAGPGSVGEKVRRLMRERGLSQRALAHASGLALSTVNEIARGEFRPGTTVLSFARLAAALGTTLGELFGGSQPVADPAEELRLLRRLDRGESPGFQRLAQRLDTLLQAPPATGERPRLELLGTDSLQVPLYTRPAQGLGAYGEPIPAWNAVPTLAVPRSLRPADGVLAAAPMRDSGMAPELRPGDVLVIHYPERQPALELLRHDELVAVTLVGPAGWTDLVRRFRSDPASGAETLVGGRPEVAAMPLRLRDLRFIGAVRMVLKRPGGVE